ncbi:hypothetical protein QBC35DRAFT_502935, partial [Podospora australis]
LATRVRVLWSWVLSDWPVCSLAQTEGFSSRAQCWACSYSCVDRVRNIISQNLFVDLKYLLACGFQHLHRQQHLQLRTTALTASQGFLPQLPQ